MSENDEPAAARVLRGFVAVAYDIARGSVAAYYPEANGLISLANFDARSGTPSYKSVPVQIRRAVQQTTQAEGKVDEPTSA